MKKDKIEFRIKTDSKGTDIHLDNMSVEAAKALLVLTGALTRIAELTGKSGDTKISITEGSACIALEAPPEEITEIETEIPVVASNKSTKKDWVEPLRDIQELICKNGLTFTANIIRDENETPVINYFKQKKIFKVARKKRHKPEFGIRFFEGKLLENGGQNPNIHIEIGAETFTVSCTEEQALKVNAFLFKTVRVSAWEKKRKGQRSSYTFCDAYGTPEVFNDFKPFIEKNLTQEGTEPLNEIHYKLRDLLEAKKFAVAKKFIRLFCYEKVDMGRLRAILIITKAFKEEPTLKDMLLNVAEILKAKTKKDIV